MGPTITTKQWEKTEVGLKCDDVDFYFSSGWGVFASGATRKGEFILEYRGEIVEEKEMTKKQVERRKSNVGSYVYEFECDKKNRKQTFL